MNFTAALAANNDLECERLIAAEIATHDWLDLAARSIAHGGWPETAAARILRIREENTALVVDVAIDFVELCPQGCKAYPRIFPQTVLAQLKLDRRTGKASLALVAEEGN
jgi:hypothetical protein